MASNKLSLIWVVLFLCMLSLLSMALSRNIVDASKPHAFSDEMGLNKRLLKQKPPCRNAAPRCHNYL
ncbi:unnamed protein product [Trifolium pratense]|uniref:Uncharacterized protein n=1 Tax=Trifolium pratense TaxID=57577 RepID=A0ACB0I9D5_TRIPR|nr:unnamed protein product [Trifolium pratense]